MSKLIETVRGVEEQVVHCCEECSLSFPATIKIGNARELDFVVCNAPRSDHYQHIVVVHHPACDCFEPK